MANIILEDDELTKYIDAFVIKSALEDCNIQSLTKLITLVYKKAIRFNKQTRQLEFKYKALGWKNNTNNYTICKHIINNILNEYKNNDILKCENYKNNIPKLLEIQQYEYRIMMDDYPKLIYQYLLNEYKT